MVNRAQLDRRWKGSLIYNAGTWKVYATVSGTKDLETTTRSAEQRCDPKGESDGIYVLGFGLGSFSTEK